MAAAPSRRFPAIPLFILLFLLVLPGLFAPYLAPHNPIRGSLRARLKPPVWVAGRHDHASRWAPTRWGATSSAASSTGRRISLAVSLVAILVSGAIGTALGLIAGYFGGRIDALIMRLVDISLGLPVILLALVFVAAVGASFWTVVSVTAVLLWARYARQVRGETLGIRERDFIARARVAGASHFRIMLRYIFPNVVNTLTVLATLQIGAVILLESALSFLGAGIPRPTPTWGSMISDGRDLIVVAWWIAMFPGPGHHADRAVPEPAGRLAARPPRPETQERLDAGRTPFATGHGRRRETTGDVVLQVDDLRTYCYHTLGRREGR